MCKLENKSLIPVKTKSDASRNTLLQVLTAIELYLNQVRFPSSTDHLIRNIFGYHTLPPPPTFQSPTVIVYPDDLLIEEDPSEEEEEEEPFIVLSRPGPIEDI